MTEPTYSYVKGQGWVLDRYHHHTFFYVDTRGIVVKAEYRRPLLGEFYYRAGIRTEDENRCLEGAKLYLPTCAYDNNSTRTNSDDEFYDKYYCIVLTPHV